jgi:hypothetical protein
MTKTCRGCAGTGIGQHVSPRTVGLLEHISYTWRFEDADNTRRPVRTIIVGRVKDEPIGSAAHHVWLITMPLALALKRAAALNAEGLSYDEESAGIPLDPAWICSWCHGTGTPQLSVGTLGVMGVQMARLESDLDDLRVRRENHAAAERARAEGRYP